VDLRRLDWFPGKAKRWLARAGEAATSQSHCLRKRPPAGQPAHRWSGENPSTRILPLQRVNPLSNIAVIDVAAVGFHEVRQGSVLDSGALVGLRQVIVDGD